MKRAKAFPTVSLVRGEGARRGRRSVSVPDRGGQKARQTVVDLRRSGGRRRPLRVITKDSGEGKSCGTRRLTR